MVRSMTESQENLFNVCKPPLPWSSNNFHSRQWAPLHFSPVSSSINANYTNGGASTSSNAEYFQSRNHLIRSAPVTPMSPLSPVYNNSSDWNFAKKFSSSSSKETLNVNPHLELIIETSGAQPSPSSSSVTPKKRKKSFAVYIILARTIFVTFLFK